MMAGLVGMILAVGAAFFLEYLDDTIKTPDDVVRTLKLSTLGAITRIRPEGEAYQHKLVSSEHPRSPISEAYRTLRTNIQFSTLDKPAKTLLVTSPNPVEGKSVTAANLAVVMAQSGMKTLLVDSDLRRPTQHKLFQVPNQKGLTNMLLLDELVLDGNIQSVDIENLSVLTSGPIPPNPSELLGSGKMQALLQQLKAVYDVIVFDSPPALAVTDAAVMSRQMDGVVLVTDSGRTRRDMAVRAKETLTKVGANILGVALNRLSERSGGYYYYYYYYARDDGGQGQRRRSHRRHWWQRLPLIGRPPRESSKPETQSEASTEE